MKNLFRNSGSFLVGAACVILAIPASAQTPQTLYDSLTKNTPSSTFFSLVGSSQTIPGGNEVGNQIFLQGGVGATLNSFTFNYYALPPGGGWNNNLSFQVTFYNNDSGVKAIAGDPTSIEPGSVIASSGIFSLPNPATLGAGNTFVNETLTASDFSKPVYLPNDFTWTVKILNGASADTVGLNFFGPLRPDPVELTWTTGSIRLVVGS